MAENKKSPRLVELVEVIHVEILRGTGTSSDPVRVVHQYWDANGELLAEKDELEILGGDHYGGAVR